MSENVIGLLPERELENPLPDGDYAIIECLGHRTVVGKVAEVERFGTTMLEVEPVFDKGLLPAIYLGGGSLYAVTPCTREVAWLRRPTRQYELPPSLRATLETPALPPRDIEFEDP